MKTEIKLKAYQKLELTGLIIILLATTIQLTFLTITNDISDGVKFLRIENKINTIFYEIVDPSPKENPNYRASYFNTQDHSGDRVDVQKRWFASLYAVVMLIGSSFLIVGRYLQMRKESANS